MFIYSRVSTKQYTYVIGGVDFNLKYIYWHTLRTHIWICVIFVKIATKIQLSCVFKHEIIKYSNVVHRVRIPFYAHGSKYSLLNLFLVVHCELMMRFHCVTNTLMMTLKDSQTSGAKSSIVASWCRNVYRKPNHTCALLSLQWSSMESTVRLSEHNTFTVNCD